MSTMQTSEDSIDPTLRSAPLASPGPAARSEKVGQAQEDDSEWEYDWDDCEIHYAVLDLTIPTPLFPHLAPGTSGSAGDKDKSGDGNNTQQATTQTAQSTDPNTTKAPRHRHKSKSHSRFKAAAVSASDPTSSNDNIPHHHHRSRTFQLQPLHKNPAPLVSFQNRIYECEWAECVGSELIIPVASSAIEEGKGEEEAGKVIAVSQTRLHGHPAIVTGRGRGLDLRALRMEKAAEGKVGEKEREKESGGGRLGMGREEGMGVRTSFWRRLEEAKRRRDGRMDEGETGSEADGRVGRGHGRGRGRGRGRRAELEEDIEADDGMEEEGLGDEDEDEEDEEFEDVDFEEAIRERERQREREREKTREKGKEDKEVEGDPMDMDKPDQPGGSTSGKT
ncbi:hypothetical protein BDZ91DRAFT_809687 [Kalaharituber pfeilii]|nr:hypothetical protein BDZ91DRAFT_809687 [Kalaharituber pfeilii]